MAHETRHTWRLRRVETCATHSSSSSFKLLFYQHNFSSWMKRRKMDTTRLQIDKKGKENLRLLLLVGISLRQEWVWCCFVYCYTPSSLDVTDSCFFHSYFHLFFFFFFFMSIPSLRMLLLALSFSSPLFHHHHLITFISFPPPIV